MDDPENSEPYRVGKYLMIGHRKIWLGSFSIWYWTCALGIFLVSPFLAMASYYQTEAAKAVYEMIRGVMGFLLAGQAWFIFLVLVSCIFELVYGTRIDAPSSLSGDVSDSLLSGDSSSHPDSMLLAHLAVANLLTLAVLVTQMKFSPQGWAAGFQAIFASMYGLFGIIKFMHATTKGKPTSGFRILGFFLGVAFLLGIIFHYRNSFASVI